ncbi:serine protease [Chryseobacterium sp. Ch-15]|uniref:Serine protease n=1 Tax=Chryseobacterium muglaense TaxID=2893752 RepID=A0A9Q3UV71_9FLAO|nr:serine protease [Chryseobacterium muglaense]MBD3905199.1 trypsin-like peptidase domain-containing protein [Chryseobacterium muglaense]MCC9034096.1 serine protease [Chryseobacterium muglaense]MCM2555089.1 serine protease [Chryseobacterium muglaense]
MVFYIDDLYRVVCNIRIPIASNEEIGTAIFVIKGNMAYIITAAHVVKNLNAAAYVIISDNNGNPLRVPLSTLLQGANFENHPEADLAKARININYFNKHLLENRFFPFEQINTSTNLISKDTLLTTVGFPLGLGTAGLKFSPLTYRTHVSAAAITLNRFDIKDRAVPNNFVILESPSIGGYSGGPVFDLGYKVDGLLTQNTGRTILHGIVHGTLSDPTGGKLAAITPLNYLNGWLN